MAADHLATKLFKEEPENFKHGVRRGSVLHPPVVISPYHPYHLQSSLILEHIEVMGIVQRNGYWWMQDRATSHTTLEVLWFFFDKFCGRVISRRSEIIWVLYRPDLNIFIYFLWLYATMQVQRRKPTTIKELKKLSRTPRVQFWRRWSGMRWQIYTYSAEPAKQPLAVILSLF